MTEERDCVTVRIENLLDHLSASFTPSKPIIAKVDQHLRQANEKDFEPEIVSIGPIHRGKDRVKGMEQHKLRYLRKVVGRRDELSIEKCVLEVRSMEQKARLYYPKSISLDQDEFVEMLLLDGCFVIELLRSYWFSDLRDKNDQIFQFDHMLAQIRHDLLLLENQLPFFVLNELFDMTKMEDPDDNIHDLLLFLAGDALPWPDSSKLDSSSDMLHNAEHLLGLVYDSCFSFSFSAKHFTENNGSNTVHHTYSASEMEEGGIRLHGSRGISLRDISFTKGVIKLPPLCISDKTESLLRNLIAYELCFPNDHPRYVKDYLFFIHCFIRSTKDVEILRRSGIISNFLGSDEMICSMFNRLGKNVVVSSSDFCYSNVFESVNRYERLRRGRWMARVRRNYLKISAVLCFSY
ncbi:putative UPF0481 protein At3g02645 isoform X1 [Salvia miltiorrhiza]|uniref:putative UPF0481 protein At3g02645 isoform X1 n=1 Tax=Salvia miltiorrhiza TaxID=226208 RepID=UPI0025AC25BF|nr:putative UPF0481 protein At3g02645 isoform X1 [Salvia miltiorrhiza]